MRNLAWGKPTKQSSTNMFNYSSNAVDGKSDPMSTNRSCAITRLSFGSWWQVDLQAMYSIHEVVVTNLADCCGKSD